MGNGKYVIGADFGTLSARAVLASVETGKIIAAASMDYPNAVMDQKLPDGTPLQGDWALQHPQDYLDCIKYIFPKVIQMGGINPQDIIGVGTDFTECTMLPTKKDGTPLCFFEQYKSNPHAYVKLWKHHAAQDEANKLNSIAKSRGEEFLNYYGGKISSEWMFPKIWQILDEAPEIYSAADRFMELADWIAFQLTGEEKRNSCTAGYKSIWQKSTGYPADDFFKALDPRLEHVVDEKLSRDIYPLGTRAGCITEKTAKWTGLLPGTPVAVGCGDAHAAVPGAGITEPSVMLMVIGTSGCDMMASETEIKVEGMCGICEDGILPGYYGYEAGQAGMGDHFQWFMENMVPSKYEKAAKEQGVSSFDYFNSLAGKLKPGQSGLLALDWWNGNRSVLVDVNLTGMMMGMSLQTRPEEIYRALIEAVAYGKRMIIDAFRKNGVPIKKLYATGGIAEKNPFLMQIFADVINQPVYVSAVDNATCMGAAMWGTVAAGARNGGYDSIAAAAEAMGGGVRATYLPCGEDAVIYEKLYAEYVKMHDYLGRESDVMKRLKKLKSMNG